MGDYEEFFKRRAWLDYAYRYARSLRMSPWGLAGVLLARVSALTPPNVVARLTDGDLAMSLNVNLALVGPTGSGKGKAMAQGRHLVPAPPLSTLAEVKPKTGESIPARFVAKTPATDGDGKQVKGEYTDKVVTDRALVFVPEIVSMRAAMSRQGSTLLPVLLEAFSNEPMGDDTKGKQYQIKLPPYSYRLSSVVGVQPNNSGTLFNEAQTGLAGRFAYMPSTDPDMPEERPAKPLGGFPFDPMSLPEGNSFAQLEALIRLGGVENMPHNGPGSREGYPLTVMTFPESVAGDVDAAQRLSAQGRADPLDAHRIELVGRFAALFAIMEGRTTVDKDDWKLALAFMDKSDATRAKCAAQRKQSDVDRQSDAIAVKREAEEQADRTVIDRTKTRLLELLDTLDPAREGVASRTLKLKLSRPQQRVFEDTIESLFEEGVIDRRDGARGGEIYSLSVA